MKKKIVIACILFALSFVLEGIASRLLPFDEIIKKALGSSKA